MLIPEINMAEKPEALTISNKKTMYLGNETRYHRNSNAIPLFSTTTESMVVMPTLPNVDRLPETNYGGSQTGIVVTPVL